MPYLLPRMIKPITLNPVSFRISDLDKLRQVFLGVSGSGVLIRMSGKAQFFEEIVTMRSGDEMLEKSGSVSKCTVAVKHFAFVQGKCIFIRIWKFKFFHFCQAQNIALVFGYQVGERLDFFFWLWHKSGEIGLVLFT